MIPFIIILALVILAVDLAVRFVVDPYLKASRMKTKAANSYSSKFDPNFKLATETMFDGGTEHKGETPVSSVEEEKSKKAAEDNSKL